jgi:hypothetical protein
MENFKDLLVIILDLKYSKYINKKSYICIYKDCSVSACFNYIYNKKRLYCNKHKLNNMININDIKRFCIIDKCMIRACYNYETENNGIYCKTHKLKNMINVLDKNKKCGYKECNKISIYNYENEKKGIYCKIHKLENMIDIVNKNKICIIKNCTIRAGYNYENEKKGIYCRNHKLANMIDILHNKCKFTNCNIRPIYNYENEKKGIYCNKHKLENMIDVVNKNLLCKMCKMIRSEKRLEFLCSLCFYYTYPNHEKTHNHKTKENQIISDLNKEFNNIIIQDKLISGGCSKRRPDGLIQLNDYNIIIEIDEYQHKDYSCENKRIMEIFKDLGNSPLTIIRFNPDAYIIDNKKTKSPFGITKSDGKLKIINKKEYNIRINELIRVINNNINEISKKDINIIQLYYDQ